MCGGNKDPFGSPNDLGLRIGIRIGLRNLNLVFLCIMGSAPKVRYRKRLCRDCSGTLLPTVGDESPREGRESRENSSERILDVVESDVRFTEVFALNCACITQP
jgi:hypothetical protein